MAGLVLAAGASLVGVQGAAPATAATRPPGPTTSAPTLPVPRATVAPDLAVGGPRLASTGVVTDLPAGVPAPPRLKDVAWVLADLDTGDVVAAKAPHARLLPASTLKTLTALVLLPKIPATRAVRATQADASADGTRVGLVPGYRYTARQLFQALLMSSGNDAAYALAEAGGGRQATLAAMNATAAHLGAHDTVARDPSGLDAPGQTSSAYDLALIGRAALGLEEFRGYVTTRKAQFPGRRDARTKKPTSFTITNHNTLLFNYPGTIGVKNGYTEAAHRTFISAVTRGGRTYLLTEMYGLDGSWRPQAAMYDWAFRYTAQARPVGRLVDPGEVPSPPQPVAPTPSPTLATAGRATAAAAAVPASRLGPDRLPDPPPWAGAVVLVALAGLVTVRRRVVRRRRLRRVH